MTDHFNGYMHNKCPVCGGEFLSEKGLQMHCVWQNDYKHALILMLGFEHHHLKSHLKLRKKLLNMMCNGTLKLRIGNL